MNLPHSLGPASQHRHVVLGAVGLLAGLGLLLGCGSNGLDTTSGSDPSLGTPSGSASAGGASTATASPTRTPSPRPSASRPVTPSPSGTTASTPTPTPSSGPGVCTLGDLTLGIGGGDGAAGSQYFRLTFRNHSASTCTMDGHPGVSFVGKGNGTQLGDPAGRNGGTRLVRLAAGATTSAVLQVAQVGDYDAADCAPTTADGFRVYPPDSRASTFVAFKVQACQRSLGSNGPQLSVSAVGDSR